MDLAASSAPSPSLRRLLGIFCLLALLSLGLQLTPGSASPATSLQGVLVFVAAAIALIPPLNRGATSVLDRLRVLSPPTRTWVMLAVWLIATAYLIYTALTHHRYLLPQWDDENSYLIQTRMMAHGRLWEPAHPLADFFETFHMLTRPVYCSIYFPGTALLYAPGIWLSLPIWALPVTAAGGVVAMAYRISAELLDDLSGLLAAMLILADMSFQDSATRVMAQIPAALIGLMMVWAWLTWRRGGSPAAAPILQRDRVCPLRRFWILDFGFWIGNKTPLPASIQNPQSEIQNGRRLGWAALIGAFAGWAVIIRPFDGLAFALPIGCAVLWRLRCAFWRDRVRTIGVMVLGAMPFLGLQTVFNVGVTGSAFTTPYAMEQQQELPGMLPGFRPFDPAARPASLLPQKQLAYRGFVQEIAEHRISSAPALLWTLTRLTARMSVPCGLLVLLLPLGILRTGSRGRWVLWSVLPLFLCLYVLYPIFLLHYAVPMVPIAAFAVMLGAHTLATASARIPYQRFARVFFPLAIAGLAIGAFPEIDARGEQQIHLTRPAWVVDQQLQAHVQAPAIVLFRFPSGHFPHDELAEPVYNSDVVWPDAAPIIRAHDLGSRNAELFAYYARRKPSRRVYLYNRADDSVRYLGTVGALAP